MSNIVYDSFRRAFSEGSASYVCYFNKDVWMRVYRVLDYVISHTFTSRRFDTANSETVDAENKRERAFTQNKERSQPSLAYNFAYRCR